MKKMMLLLLITILVFALSLTVSANDLEDIEAVGGITYNLFTSEDFEDIGEEFDVESGIGFYAGGRYWFTDILGVEAGLDYATSSDSTTEEGITIDFSQRIMGPYAKLAIKPIDQIVLKGGPTYYSGKVEVDSPFLSDDNRGSGLGFMLGAVLDYPIDNYLMVTGNADYRIAEISYDDADDFDVSGVSLGIGISYQF